MTTIRATAQVITKPSNLFARGAIIAGKRVERWKADNEQWLDQPLKWRKPRKIFVCAHGDLFHPSVPDEWIDRVFAVMALASQHTFQVLTKRPERAREYLNRLFSEFGNMVWWTVRFRDAARKAGGLLFDLNELRGRAWPLPNVWLGTSVSDQDSADLRIPDLLACPAAVRFISAEPLLGPVDLTLDSINWVIVGGESGPHARPMHPDWARSLRDQCAAAGVPFLFKQWGEFEALGPTTSMLGLKGMLTNKWVQMGGHGFLRIGKNHAGRLLDGVEHNGFPEVQP